MQKIMIVIGAIFAITLGAFSANAATLTNINGDVKVNKGNGYQTVKKPINLNPGDKVLVGQNGSANIAYPSGASLPVGPGVTSVTSAVGSAGIVGGLTTTTLVVGGAVVAGGVAAAIAIANKDDSPASP